MKIELVGVNAGDYDQKAVFLIDEDGKNYLVFIQGYDSYCKGLGGDYYKYLFSFAKEEEARAFSLKAKENRFYIGEEDGFQPLSCKDSGWKKEIKKNSDVVCYWERIISELDLP